MDRNEGGERDSKVLQVATIPRPVLKSGRWLSRRSHPKLVGFNWLSLQATQTER